MFSTSMYVDILQLLDLLLDNFLKSVYHSSYKVNLEVENNETINFLDLTIKFSEGNKVLKFAASLYVSI